MERSSFAFKALRKCNKRFKLESFLGDCRELRFRLLIVIINSGVPQSPAGVLLLLGKQVEHLPHASQLLLLLAPRSHFPLKLPAGLRAGSQCRETCVRSFHLPEGELRRLYYYFLFPEEAGVYRRQSLEALKAAAELRGEGSRATAGNYSTSVRGTTLVRPNNRRAAGREGWMRMRDGDLSAPYPRSSRARRRRRSGCLRYDQKTCNIFISKQAVKALAQR